jgi:gliding motility-associated-like protein
MKPYLFLPVVAAGLFWIMAFDLSPQTTQVEICDNAVDDDGDGLIDLNDRDCDCPVLLPTSLIPNPSFEEKKCCPFDRSQLYCATGWIQASEATTDFLHDCGWMGWDDLPPPLPFPDGKGCVGWRNGRSGGPFGQGPVPNWKEYAGACLTAPLKAATSYRFEFYVGFTRAINSPPTTIDFFGTPDCSYLPFGVGDENFGCPTNGPGWVHLGSVAISGVNSWKLTEITVIPTMDIHAIAIGPNCTPIPSDVNTYYFFDNLVLAETKEFELKISAKGHPCSDDFTLEIPYRDTLTYQWYKNGIALPGETSPQLKRTKGEGDYKVRVLSPYSCRVTPAYRHKIPVLYAEEKMVICYGDSYPFARQKLRYSGVYMDTLASIHQCDSIVRLTLEVMGENTDTVYAKIFDRESWKVGPFNFTKPGEYDVRLLSYLGCDSLVHLVLGVYKMFIPNVFSPNGDGLNDYFTVFAGDDVKEILTLQVFDRWGGLIYETANLSEGESHDGWDGKRKGKLVEEGVYMYQIRVVFQDGKEREITGSLALIR